jgi:hypothetical protein
MLEGTTLLSLHYVAEINKMGLNKEQHFKHLLYFKQLILNLNQCWVPVSWWSASSSATKPQLCPIARKYIPKKQERCNKYTVTV